MRWLENGFQDLRYAIRTFANAPGFTAVAVLSLTLGVAANALMFTVVKALLWPAMPVENPSELVVIYSTTTNRVTVGLMSALGLSRIFSNLLYGIAPTNALSFGLGSACILTLTVLASYVPARKVVTVDPGITLRSE
jgi:hypothetical protein